MQQVPVSVANVATLLSLGFTRIEMWASADGGLNYEEVTSSAAKAASLVSNPAKTTFALGGRSLTVSIDGGDATLITFDSEVLNWTPAQVVTRINQVVAGLASLSSDNLSVILSSSSTGRSSTVQITSLDCSDILGWVDGQAATGTDARIPLVSGTLRYVYNDSAGGADFLYKWRFSQNGLNPISEFTAPVHGSPPPITGLNVAVGTAQFADFQGRPIQRTVVIVADLGPMAISGMGVGQPAPLVVSSDDNGYLQVELVQGMRVRVAIEGTAYVREITVPNTATFDLLSAMASAPDPFTIQVPPPFLIRRTVG